jgi:hypothetical protein
MKNRCRHPAFWAVVMAVSLSLPTQLSFAQDNNASSKSVTHKHHKMQRAAYPELEQYRSSDFVGQFPGSCAYDRAAGACMMDLGYGRCMPCSSGPMR